MFAGIWSFSTIKPFIYGQHNTNSYFARNILLISGFESEYLIPEQLLKADIAKTCTVEAANLLYRLGFVNTVIILFSHYFGTVLPVTSNGSLLREMIQCKGKHCKAMKSYGCDLKMHIQHFKDSLVI